MEIQVVCLVCLLLFVQSFQVLNDKLVSVFGKLGQGNVATLWSKITALEKALNPDYLSNLKLSDSAKSELLIGYASQLKDLSKPIEELQQLKDYLNLTEFQGLEGHENKLASIANVHAKQELQMEEMSRQIHELMSGYSRVMLQLSAQLVECGETVTRMESKK